MRETKCRGCGVDSWLIKVVIKQCTLLVVLIKAVFAGILLKWPIPAADADGSSSSALSRRPHHAGVAPGICPVSD